MLIVGLQDESGNDIVIGIDSVALINTVSDSHTAYFYSFKQDTGVPIYAGKYKVFAEVLVQSGYTIDADPSNSRIDHAPISINVGDCNLDGSCDMADISTCIDAFMMAYPFP